jgi:hypothetical protein
LQAAIPSAETLHSKKKAVNGKKGIKNNGNTIKTTTDGKNENQSIFVQHSSRTPGKVTQSFNSTINNI